ncbi:Polyhydroxyalkanoic acid synthase (plasmid) [Sinorhizobium alkalisoli]|nr:Polyhydroxyalkanoic acid synthase [Sinorhizobium alkalisoli]
MQRSTHIQDFGWLVRYLVSRGYTFFCISWRNPTAKDRGLTLDDYRRLGIMASLDAVSAIVPELKAYATGYCLGGTLSAIAAAAMARAKDKRLASVTLFAAQTDFFEPGELARFIDHSQMHYLESMMWKSGRLSADHMAGVFQQLRTNDLVWSHLVNDYLLGERPHERSHGMECGLDAHALPDACRISAAPPSRQRTCLRPFHRRQTPGSPPEHPASHVRRRDRARSRRTVALCLQDTLSRQYRRHLCADKRGPQRRHCLRTRPSRITFSNRIDPARAIPLSALRNGPRQPCLRVVHGGRGGEWLASHPAPERVAPPDIGASKKGYPSTGDAPGTYVHQRKTHVFGSGGSAMPKGNQSSIASAAAPPVILYAPYWRAWRDDRRGGQADCCPSRTIRLTSVERVYVELSLPTIDSGS